jgi:hypothetical protein
MRGEKEPLYRKINWRTYHVDNHSNKDANKDRGRKNGVSAKMSSKRHGLDYTPLFKFLLSKIGKSWDAVYSEAISRLDSKEPITWIMDKERDSFMVGNARFNTLFVDNDGLIQKVNPDLKNEDFDESCYCCTHTFNGKPLNNKYKTLNNV